MTLYILPLIFLLLSVFPQLFSSRHKERIFAFLFFIIGFFILTYVNVFRDMIGGYDVYVYEFYFENLASLGNYFNYEIGFYYFSLVVSYISQNKYFYFGIIAFLFCINVLFLSKKMSGEFYFLLFFLIFCRMYFYSFIYLRQVMAMLLVWWAIYYLSLGRNRIFLFLVFLAVLFHVSALISFFFIFSKRKYDKSVFFIAFVLLALMCFFPLDYIVNVIEFNYIKRDFNIFYLLESLILCVVLSLLYKKINSNRLVVLFNISYFYTMLNFFVSFFNGLARLTWYPFFAAVALLSFFLIQMRNTRYKVFILLLILGYFIIFYIKIMIFRDDGDMIPYKSIFSDVIRDSQFKPL